MKCYNNYISDQVERPIFLYYKMGKGSNSLLPDIAFFVLSLSLQTDQFSLVVRLSLVDNYIIIIGVTYQWLYCLLQSCISASMAEYEHTPGGACLAHDRLGTVLYGTGQTLYRTELYRPAAHVTASCITDSNHACLSDTATHDCRGCPAH